MSSTGKRTKEPYLVAIRTVPVDEVRDGDDRIAIVVRVPACTSSSLVVCCLSEGNSQ